MLSTFTEAHIAAHSHSLLTYTMHQGRTGSSQNRRAEILPGGCYQYSPFLYPHGAKWFSGRSWNPRTRNDPGASVWHYPLSQPVCVHRNPDHLWWGNLCLSVDQHPTGQARGTTPNHPATQPGATAKSCTPQTVAQDPQGRAINEPI